MHNQSYEDIINLPHHVSATRPQMSMAKRAAQFSPFAALTGYDATIAETARQTEPYADPAEDRKAMLNEKMQLVMDMVDAQPEVTITYFTPDEKKAGGAYLRATGRVKKVDSYRRTMVLTDGTEIPFRWISEIDSPLFRHLDSDCETGGAHP